jgi:hypothetical protein
VSTLSFLGKSNKGSEGIDENDMEMFDDTAAAAQREEVNGVGENAQEQESAPAAEPRSEPHLPPAQLPASLLNSGVLQVPNLMTCSHLAVPDGSVRNIMVAWYWAGYYTGLHEGKNQPAK